MVLHAINLGILTLLFFILGMIKPKWPLFFMEKPSRWHVTMVSTVFFMIFMTMFAEGHRQKQILEKHKHATASTAAAAPVPVPVPEAVPVPVPVDPPKNGPAKK